MENLVGKKFNLYTVIDGPIRKENTKKIYWKCQCDCGTIKDVRGDQLKAGTTKSCGCLKNKIFIENNIKRQTLDLTGFRYGRLIAIEPTNERKDGRVVWKCICDCGNVCYYDTHSLQGKKVKSCGCMRSEGEDTIRKLLLQYNIPFEEQKTFKTCVFNDSGYLAKFDFFIDNKYLIEYDGEQHFYYKNNEHTWNNKDNYERVKEHDKYKNKWCKDNKIILLRIPYTALDKLKIEDLDINSKFRII